MVGAKITCIVWVRKVLLTDCQDKRAIFRRKKKKEKKNNKLVLWGFLVKDERGEAASMWSITSIQPVERWRDRGQRSPAVTQTGQLDTGEGQVGHFVIRVTPCYTWAKLTATKSCGGSWELGARRHFFTPVAQLDSSGLRWPEILVLHVSVGYIIPVQLKQLIPISDIRTEEENINFHKTWGRGSFRGRQIVFFSFSLTTVWEETLISEPARTPKDVTLCHFTYLRPNVLCVTVQSYAC